MVYAVAILLISALTTVGLIAVWAATSLGNWFWRTMAFLGAMSPLLLIPAYEPFVAFVIQGAVVAAGVQLARWRAHRGSGEPFFQSRFSLKTILLAMVPAALLAAVAVRLPALNFLAWRSVVLIGVVAGVATLLGGWIVAGGCWSWKVRIVVGLLSALAVSMILAAGDWYLPGFDYLGVWPPEPHYMSFASAFHGRQGIDNLTLTWLVIIVALTLIITGTIAIAPACDIGSLQRSRSRIVAALVLTLIAAVPAIAAYWEVMHPLPIPAIELPNPNGYDEFLAAAKMLPAHPIVDSNGFDPDTATVQQFEQAVEEIRPALDQTRVGLDRKVMIPLDYSYYSLNITTIGEFRTIARGFDARGRLAAKQKDWAAATEHHLDGSRFGLLLSRGGLIVDDLVGVACTGIACRGLYECVENLPADRLAELIGQLHEFESIRDTCDEFIARDAVWSEHAMGWYGHLVLELAKLVGDEISSEDAFRRARARELATLRLLQLELALRLYEHDHGKHPESLDLLVPKYIEAVPIDPMSSDGEPLRYLKTEAGIVPYSLGMNGVDDGGAADEDDYWEGDLRLDVLWAPRPAASQPATAALSASDDELEAKSDEED